MSPKHYTEVSYIGEIEGICMKKGFLKIMMLHIISKGPSTGYSIMKEIGEMTGRKPSCGAVYPMLKAMEFDGLIASKGEGGKVYYTITDEGVEKLQELKELKKEYLHKIGEILSIAGEVFDDVQVDRNMEIMYIIGPIISEVMRLKAKGVDIDSIKEALEPALKRLRELDGDEGDEG